jgi:hypothetical protein
LAVFSAEFCVELRASIPARDWAVMIAAQLNNGEISCSMSGKDILRGIRKGFFDAELQATVF